MTTGNEILAQEAAASLAAAQRPALSRALLFDRRRLLPYVVLGGSGVGTLAGMLAGGIAGDLEDPRGLLLTAFVVGITVGMLVGWTVLVVAASALASAPAAGWRLTAVRAALSLPAHLSSGVGSAVALALLGGGLTTVSGNLGGIVVTLLAFDLLLLPLNLAFARRFRPIRSTTMPEAIRETVHGGRETDSISPFGVTVIAGIVWFVLGAFIILGAMALAQSIAPGAYAAAFDRFGGPLGVAILVTWGLLVVFGARVTGRLINRLRG